MNEAEREARELLDGYKVFFDDVLVNSNTLTRIIKALQRAEQRGRDEGRQALANCCENEDDFRKEAGRVLTEHEVHGDSWGVPMIQDVGKLLVDKLTEARAEVQKLKGA